jgi:aspartyl-tRNA(Asn)/glutamyl-tRNA(Gln) amidotransferase subunit A
MGASDDLCWMSASDLAAAIRRRKVSPVAVVDAVLGRIDALKQLNAYVTVDADGARKAARAAERAMMKRGAKLGPLHGVPFSVKDLIATQGLRTTYGTPLYRDHVPTEDAPSVARMKQAGAILIGKTNTPTLGWVGVTDNLLVGATRNPWQLERTPGGSSGGAGAAVAAGLAPLAIGTDGGGSIRKPAAWCGIVGHKPSYGRIALAPHGAAWPLSHAGPMTRTVADAALMMNACAGADDRDPLSLSSDGVDYVRALRGGVKGLRIAWSPTMGIAPVVDPDIEAACARAARVFRQLGARVEEVEPDWPSPYDCWRTTFYGGIAARLQPYLDRRGEIDPGLLEIVQEALRFPSTKYAQAGFDRLGWWQHARAFFAKYDLLLTPTAAGPPLLIGELFAKEIAGRAVGREAGSAFTFPFNVTGQPACSVPAGFTPDGCPVGLQIVGRRFDDVTVLRAAAAFEAARPWAAARPPFA